MMDGVYEAFSTGKHTLIEAGTGVGKSLAYLLPVAYFAKQNKLRVVVSTHTIQLQEQIIHNEIPLLAKILPFEVKTVLLKGRNHYISLEKFARSLLEENDNYDTTLTKMQILVWLNRNKHRRSRRIEFIKWWTISSGIKLSIMRSIFSKGKFLEDKRFLFENKKRRFESRFNYYKS